MWGAGDLAPVLEVLVIAPGTSVAMYLVKVLLPSADWEDGMASALLSAGVGADQAAIRPPGRGYYKRVQGVCDRSSLPANEMQAVASEVVLTLSIAQTTLPRLAEVALGAPRLHRQLLDARLEVAWGLSADADALCKPTLRVAAGGLVATADQFDGFLRVNLTALLSRQATRGERLEPVLAQLKAGRLSSSSEELEGLIIDLLWELKREPRHAARKASSTLPPPPHPASRPPACFPPASASFTRNPNFTGREREPLRNWPRGWWTPSRPAGRRTTDLTAEPPRAAPPTADKLQMTVRRRPLRQRSVSRRPSP